MKAWKRLALLMGCLLSVSIAASCAPAPLCITKCGLVADVLPVGWSCADLQGRESAALWAYRSTKDPRLTICNLTRYHLAVVDAGYWWSFGRNVAGMTYCENGSIVIGSQPPAGSALVHEMGHALQGCAPLGPDNPKDHYHSNWDRDGIYAAIDKATTWDGGQ